MSNFFIWRGCDISGTDARDAINTNSDLLNRAAALLVEPSGLPPDAAGGPTICIIDASWSTPVNNGQGQLEPGTYKHRLIPIDTCTGQTGPAYDMPDLVITELGQLAMLAVTFCEYPNDCLSVIIQRNGVVVGDFIPLTPLVDGFPTTRNLDVDGTYTSGTTQTFVRDPGSPGLLGINDVGGPDTVELQVVNGARLGRASVVVQEVAGDLVTFAPPLSASPELKPYSFMDLGQRTGLYTAPPFPFVGSAAVQVPNLFPFNIVMPTVTFSSPFMAFKSIPLPSGFGSGASIVPFSGTSTFSDENEMRVENLAGLTATSVGRPLLLQGVGLPINGVNCTVSDYNQGRMTVSAIVDGSSNPLPLTSAYVNSYIKIGDGNPATDARFGTFLITQIVSDTELLVANTNDAVPTGSLSGVNWELKVKSISGIFNITKVLSSTIALVSTGVDPNPAPPGPGLPPVPPVFPAVPDPNNGSILWLATNISVPKPGDLITWLNSTALVVKVDVIENPLAVLDPLAAPFNEVNVAVIPFNFLAIPWPAGLFRIVNRPQWPISLGNYYIDLGKSPIGDRTIPPLPAVGGVTYTRCLDFEVRGNGNSSLPAPDAGAPLDSGLQVGRSIIVDGKPLTIVDVKPATRLGGSAPDPLSDIYDYAVVTVNPFPESADPTKPLSGSIPFFNNVAYGVYITISLELSPFIDRSGIAAVGPYKRITRTTETIQQSGLFQYMEAGQNLLRTGEIPASAKDTFQKLDQVMTQAGYAGGLNSLLEKLRGPTATLTNRSFNNFLGTFVQTRNGERYFAVNNTATSGSCDAISVDTIRALRPLLCDSFSRVQEVAESMEASGGLAIMRFEERTRTVVPANCPPGQVGTVVTDYVCLGVATTSGPNRLLPNQFARVFWSGTAIDQPGTRNRLRAFGLTDEEITAALSLRAFGRVLSTQDITDTLQGIFDLRDTGALADDIIDDTRISLLSPCLVTPGQLSEVIRIRGVGGVVQRPIGTDPASTAFVDDFSPITPNLLDLLATSSFNLCDFGALLALIPDAGIRNTVAGFLSIIEAATENLKKLCATIREYWLDNPFYLAIKEAIAGLIAATSADPTMGCFAGPMNAIGSFSGLPTIPTIPAVEEGILSAAGQFSMRFDLIRMATTIIQTLACKILDAITSMVSLLGGDGDAVKRLIGCLPSVDAFSANLSGMSLDFSLFIQCNFELYRMILDMAQAVISEINEIINLINSFGNGFFFRGAQAKNIACSSDQSLASSAAAAAAALGLPTSVVSLIMP
jgi:hypothetical protein